MLNDNLLYKQVHISANADFFASSGELDLRSLVLDNLNLRKTTYDPDYLQNLRLNASQTWLKGFSYEEWEKLVA